MDSPLFKFGIQEAQLVLPRCHHSGILYEIVLKIFSGRSKGVPLMDFCDRGDKELKDWSRSGLFVFAIISGWKLQENNGK